MFNLDGVKHGLKVYTAGGSITPGTAVYISADNTVKTAALGSVPIGVALGAATIASGESVEVMPFSAECETKLIAAGTIAVGAQVEIILSGSDAGKVQSASTGIPRFVANEAAVSGDYVLLRPISTNNLPMGCSAGALNATGTLTAALIAGGIVTSTTGSGAVTATVDTAANLDTQFPLLQVGQFIDLSIVNTGGSNAFTVSVSGVTGLTLVGSGTVAASTSARFRLLKTGPSTYTLYRL